ncbi:MAG: bifunctional adenosylcobinamide kinase/adenosylcobinamide-phosphate guanylyltransferase [Chloroflexota bacterium]|nr:bifunctional adenosylcobinamide kinase/adenosylcobinamide-phosphate guanylyltransferase [Chloroflexota bacterium]
MSTDLVFVTGAARSGKSRYAERLASRMADGGPVLYVATAEAHDEEMRERVRLHRERRPDDWGTLEARRQVAAQLREIQQDAPVVLLDCLSMLVSNILLNAAGKLGEDSPLLQSTTLEETDTEVGALLEWQEERGSALVVVSNEVGWGVVPPYRLGRIYRDVLGSANQRVAAAASGAYLLVTGIPLALKDKAVD